MPASYVLVGHRSPTEREVRRRQRRFAIVAVVVPRQHARVHLVIVERGDVIARVLEPTVGERRRNDAAARVRPQPDRCRETAEDEPSFHAANCRRARIVQTVRMISPATTDALS